MSRILPPQFGRYIASIAWLVALTVYFFLWDIAPQLSIFRKENMLLIVGVGLLGFSLTMFAARKKYF